MTWCRTGWRGLSFAASLTVSASIAAAQSPGGRPFTVDDMLRMEGISTTVPSPDGGLIAVVIQRPRRPNDIHAHFGFFGADVRADVWLVRADGSGARALTDGVRTGAGYWNPVWSPNGAWLAMLSTEGGGAVRAWVWDRVTGQVRRVDERAVDLSTTTDGSGETLARLDWLDDSTLMLPLLPPGAKSGFDPIGASMDTTEKLWAQARAGSTSTASVLDTEVRPALGADGVELVVAYDARTRRSRTLASFPRDPTTSGVRSLVASPDGQEVLVQTSELMRPVPSQRLTRTMNRHRVGLVSTCGDTAVRWLSSIEGYSSEADDFGTIIRWSPGSERVAVAGNAADAERGELRMFVVDVGRARRAEACERAAASLSAEAREVGGITPLDARWTVGGPLMVLGQRDGRLGWWAVDAATGRSGELADAGEGDELVAGADQGLAYTISDAAVEVRSVISGVRQPVLRAPVGARLHVLWPRRSLRGARPADRLLVEETLPTPDRASARIARQIFEVAVANGRASAVPVRAPYAGWLVAGYLPSTRQVVAVRRNAEVVLTGDRGDVRLIRRNAFLDSVAPARRVLVGYRGMNGDSLQAVLLLPRGDQSGQRYPMVTWVYAGAVYTDTSQVGATPHDPSWLSMLPLVARGYAVLYPSMPLGARTDVTRDPYFDLTAGVIPAVDRVVEMGIADPSRLAVMGQSYGGYTTLGLVTLTTRFRTAIAVSALDNLVQDYGSFRPWDRTRADAHLTLANAKMAEAGQIAMGESPWDNPWRYLVNSPLMHLQRVHTPLLLLQGDQDFLELQQSEEFFTGLYRLGKRARFVRYFGDDHSNYSAANIRDFWGRVFEWLDETMPAAAPRAAR